MHTAAALLPSVDADFNKIINDLVSQGWSSIAHFFSPTLVTELHNELLEHAEHDRLRAARIGKGQQRTLRSDIRGDEIRWFNGESQPQRDYLALMERLRQRINSELFLGLNDLEAHFALYAPGAGYRKHLDSFQNNNLRRISVVGYLNENWQATDGGELLLFNDKNEVFERLLPEAGTLVCFVSEEIPHEVTITQRPRASIAGWFRVRDNTPNPPSLLIQNP